MTKEEMRNEIVSAHNARVNAVLESPAGKQERWAGRHLGSSRQVLFARSCTRTKVSSTSRNKQN
jgi:hypothetical protein